MPQHNGIHFSRTFHVGPPLLHSNSTHRVAPWLPRFSTQRTRINSTSTRDNDLLATSMISLAFSSGAGLCLDITVTWGLCQNLVGRQAACSPGFPFLFSRIHLCPELFDGAPKASLTPLQQFGPWRPVFALNYGSTLCYPKNIFHSSTLDVIVLNGVCVGGKRNSTLTSALSPSTYLKSGLIVTDNSEREVFCVAGYGEREWFVTLQ